MTKNNFFSRLIQQLVLVALLFISGFSNAQTKLADWTVSGGGFTAAPTFTNGFAHATAVSSISISHNGYSAGPFNDQSYFVHHTNTASTLNTSTAPYTQFTVNLNTSSITFDKILVKFASAGAKLQLRWSIDGYASSLGEKTDADLIVDSYLFNLSSLSAVTANTVTFRLYSYAGSSNPSNLQFSDNHSNNPENITTTYLTGAKAINIFYSAATISSTPPSITSFSPTSGAVGSTVTITGSGFNTTAANNTVFFDGVKATVTAATATSLTVTVPSGTSGFSLINYINTSDKLSCVSKKRFSTTFGNGGFSGDFSGGVAWGPNLSFSAPTNSFSGWGYGIKTPNLFADFNNDGKPDYAHIGSSSTSISPNTSSVGSMSFGTQISLNSGGNGLEVGDIDNDGLIDLVIFNSSTAFVYRNNSTVGGTISFESPISVSIATSVNRLRLNDMNSDGLIDLIGSNGSNILYLINTTSGSSITFNSVSPVSSTAPASISDFGIVDFDNNNQLDIIALHSSGYSIKLNSTAFSSLVSSSNSADMMQVGDINNDGFIDFAINFNAYSFKFFKNSGTNTFTEVVVNMSNSSGLARAIQIAEMSGNNLPDVIGCEFNAGRTYQIGNNTSTSSAISFPNCTNMYWGGNNFNTNVAVNDVDGDGRSDLTAFMSGNYIINRNIIGIPTISSFTPTSGGVGASITISGTYFVGATDVKFNGVSATSFTVNSASSITATAPVGTTGTIQVITPGGTATSSSNFTFNPSITKASNFTSFTTCSGTPSNAQTFTVSGNNLTASLSIAALTGYEYSTDGTTYSSSLTLTPTSGSIPSTTVYVRLTSSSTGSPSGNISLTSTNATTQTIAVTGTSTSTSLPTATTSYIVCLGDNAPTISATASSNHALRWYTVPTGGSASASAPVPDVSAAGTTTYYVSQFNSSTNCESARVAIIVTVYALPSAPSATTTINYCKGATPSALAATATSGLNLQWYTTATGGTASLTAPTPSTTNVGTTTYYVSQKANTGSYTLVSSNNSNLVGATPSLGQTFQVASNVILNSITFDIIYFYGNVPTTLKIYNGVGGSLIATANNIHNSSSNHNYNVQFSFTGQNIQLNTGQTYYFEVTSSVNMYVWGNYNTLTSGTAYTNGVAQANADLAFTLSSSLNVNPCESPRTTITVNINEIPTISGVQNMTVGGPLLQLTSTGTPANSSPWVSSNTAVATVSSTGEVTPVSAGTSVITFTTSSGCSITSPIVVYIIPAAPTAVTSIDYCQGATATPLSASALSGHSLQWYTAATGGTASNTAPTPTTSTVGTTTYYVSQKANLGSYSIATGNENAILGLATNFGQTFQVANNVVLNSIAFDIIYYNGASSTSTLKIYSGIGGTLIATANNTHTGSGYHNYNVTYSFANQNIILSTGQTYYFELTFTNNVYVWYKTGGLSTGDAYVNGAVQSGKDIGFTLSSTLNVSPYESARTAITVNVNAVPTISGVQNMTVGGGTLQLTGSGTPDATTPWSSSNPAVATISSTGLVTAVGGGSTTLTYTVSNGCTATAVISVVDCSQPLGNVLHFDGVDDYFTTASNIAALNITANLTLETWIKFDQTHSDWVRLIGKGDANNRTYGLWLGTDGKLLFQINGTPTGLNFSSTTALQPGIWYHIAAVRNGSSAKILINGVEDATATTSVSPQTNTFPLTVGYGTLHTYLKGSLEDVRVWNIARSDSQIQQGMYNSVAGNETGLVAYYDFNQGIANGNNTAITTANDKSLNALHATLTNFGKTGATSNFIGNTIVNFAVSGTSIVCANSTSQFTHPRSGGTWSISNGASASINSSGLVTTLENENVTVFYTYTINGCSVTDSKSVSINTPTAPVVTSPVNLCQGVTATALTATPASGSNLLWYTAATGGTASSTAPTPSTTTVGSTTYYVSQKAPSGPYIIDNVYNYNYANNISTFGQTFTPANNIILNSITLKTAYINTNTPNIVLKIYNGYGGALLATANSPFTSSYGYTWFNDLGFSFSGQNLVLTGGQTYYLEFVPNSTMYPGYSNAYANGTGYVGGTVISQDFAFKLDAAINSNPCESPRTAITVNVNALPTISGVQNMTVGGTNIQLTGSGTPDATTPWSSSNTSVVSISSTGEVTAQGGGTATITYTTASGCSITATIRVIDCSQPLGNALAFGNGTVAANADNVQVNTRIFPTNTVANFTIETWIKPSILDMDADYHGFLGSNSRNTSLYVWNNGRIHFSSPENYFNTPNVLLTQDKWSHLALVKNGTTITLYVNGVQGYTQSCPANISLNDNYYWLGKIDNQFNGALDEVRFWSTARTQAQIAASMYTELVGNEAGLLANFDFNQGIANGNNTTITTVINKANSSLNGTLTNFTKTGTSSNFVANTITSYPITGAAIVCANSTAQYTHPVSGGTWTLSNGANATISNTGLLTTAANENITVSYSYTINGCSKTETKTVTIESPLISGLTLVGAGNTITLSASTTPASSNAWVSSNPSKATVSASGVVSGLATGTTIITFTNNNACTDTALITIVTGTTLAPTLTSPATNTTGATTLNIVYSLPEAPLSGSVTLTFTPVGGGTPIVWTMNNATNANFNYVVGTNPISSTVTAGVALGFTTYNVTLAYQDAFSNPASSVTNLNIQTLAPPVISFNNTSFATVVNSTLTINTINTGGSMVTYSIAPTLPTGFTFNTTTGVITGSSTVAISATTFTVTATNAAGTDTEPFSLAITADTDGDGIPDIADADVNGDGVIDNGPDTDGDGIIDQYDNDIDGDGIPNNLDNDADGDGVPNAQDVCSFIPNTAITVQPSTTSQVICPSASIGALTVTATGPGLSYQWYRNTTASTTGGTLLPGATNASYTPLNTVVGTVYYYVVVSGTCGNATSNVSGSILVTDVTLPTVITQNRTIYLNASGQASITAAQIDNGSTDNCAIATRTLSQTSFNCAHVGTNTVTLTVTDVSGNIRTANAIVTVIDSIKPTVVTQNVTVNLNASGQASITAAQINNGSSDNCGIASVTINQTAFTCAHTGPNTVTLTVTDVNGNVKTKTAIVTVVDNILPTVVTQNVIRYLNASGQAIVTANDINNGSTDNCGIGTVALSQTAFTCAHVGVNTVTLTVTDTKGNSATGQATVTIIDNTPPTANAQNINAYLNAGGAVTVTPSQVGSGSTDNCSIATMTLNNTTFNCSNLGANPVILTVVDPFNNVSTANAVITVVDSIKPLLTIPADITVNTNSGCGAFGFPIGTASATDNCSVISAITNNAPSFYPVGITNIVYSVTDGSGNTKTKIQKVTVIDNVIPIITAPAAITTTLTAGCTKSGVNLGTPVTSDNCTIASVTNNAPTAFPVGTTTVTWTVTDASGNTATATQTVTVTDAINPTISAPANLTINANASCVAFGVALGTPVTADNCTVASITNNAPAVFPIGTTIVTWKVIDASGNFATSNQTVNVVDNAAPMIFAPAAITTAITSGCTLSSIALGTPVTMDNCSVATVTNNAPTTFPIGVTTVTWTATDGAGNTATATQIVTIVDNTNPTIVAPAAVTANLTTGCTATGIALGTPVTSDNCTVASVTNNAPATYPIGTTIVTWTVTDGAGNTATTAQLVTITDNTNPTISAPANITVNTNSGCTTTGIVLGTPVTADNCTVASVTNNAPTVFPIGTTTITWVVTDGAGNATTATQLVTISDAINPTISAPANITVNTNSGCTATGIALGSPVTADNCSVVSVTNNAPTTFPIGTTTVTWIVTDGAGNTASTTQTVTVNDSQIPTITPPTNVTHYVSSGCTVNGVVIGSPATADNCTVASVTNNAPAIFPIGTTSVTWIVTDVAGNTASATQLVTVIDTIAPVAQLMDATIALNVNGTATLNYAAVNNGSYDNCGIASVELSQSLFSCDDLGTQTVVVTLIDSYGNSTSQLIKVTVINSGIDVDLDGIDDACDDFVNTQIVQVPSGFSPNGDNINDTFIIPALDQFSSVHLQVYNKYGHEVYVSAKYNNDWNGSSSFNGMELPDDTYFYILTTDGELRQGFVYINRVK